MHGLKEAHVAVDRKMLAKLAETEPLSFRSILLTADTVTQPHLIPSKYYDFPTPSSENK